MSVHSVLRESLRFGNISVPGSDRMDNLPKVHSSLAHLTSRSAGPMAVWGSEHI
jgi:hypothetical protein